MKILFRCLLLFLLALNSGSAQNLSKGEKKRITEKLISQIKANYVLQHTVDAVIAEIRQSYGSKGFAKSGTVEEFSLFLTQLLRDITKDAHFGFLYNERLSRLLETEPAATNGSLDQEVNALAGNNTPSQKENFFFKKVEILEGNIGYLRLTQIPFLNGAKATLDGAMAFLSHSDAIILDLRGNRGGAGGFIPYLISYFFPKGKRLLYRREMPAPAWDSISYHYTHKEIGGKRMDKTPLYVLTDGLTGSAATNLAYTLQSFEKALIVGGNTGYGYRGAHSASLFPLPEGLVALIPIGKVVNARTNTNWRFDGVSPDIEVKSSDALQAAYYKALDTLIKKESDNDRKDQLIKILSTASVKGIGQATEKSVESKAINLSLYAGEYEGGRSVWLEDNTLRYQKVGGSPLDLKLQEEHRYKIYLPSDGSTSPSLPSVQFNLSPNGEVKELMLVFKDDRAPQGPFKKLN
ncbi:MAG: S41 family peptidase [Bacteroidota bacterium]